MTLKLKRHEIIALQRYFPTLAIPRPKESHKGMFGTLGIIGGATGMSGAPLLSGKAGLKIGAGKMIIGFAQPQLPLPLISDSPELMLATADNLLTRNAAISAWSIGSGMGLDSVADQLLTTILNLKADHYEIDKNAPILLDADALTLLAKRSPIQLPHNRHWIVTPHPKEAASLLGISVEEVQNNREGAAIVIAEKYGVLTVLKGAGTLIATKEKVIWKNRTGNAGLSTAGTGDVLAGMMGGLLAQSIPYQEAAMAAVWIHGRAADSLVASGIGPIGLTAGELIDEARTIRNQLTLHHSW